MNYFNRGIFALIKIYKKVKKKVQRTERTQRIKGPFGYNLFYRKLKIL